MTISEQNILELILPQGVFKWFDAISGKMDEDNLHIVLQEKNVPPLKEEDKNKKIIPKGFTKITITDFPIRGRRTLLTFKRRYWQVEGEKGYLKRDIKMAFPGTQLEQEFAAFLKEDGGRESGLSEFYRRVSADPDKRI